jgi:hypothetical protein
MPAAKSRLTSEQEFSAAWRLFQALHDDPTDSAAENLIVWLRGQPTRVRALNEALTVWAYAGAAIAVSRHMPAEWPELTQ